MAELGVFVIQGFLNGIQSLVGNVSAFFRTAWEGIKSVWSEVFKWFETNIIEPVKKAFDASLKGIYEFFQKAWANVKSVWNIASGWFETYVTKPIKDAFDGAIKDITGFFQGLWDFISGIFGKIGDLIGGLLDDIGNLVSGTNKAAKSASSISNSSGGHITPVASVLSAASFGNVQIPALARGGIVDSATIALIGERGREAVLPLDGNNPWTESLNDIRNMIDETNRLLERLIGVSGGDTYLDGRLVSDGVFPYLDSWEQRRGKRVK